VADRHPGRAGTAAAVVAALALGLAACGPSRAANGARAAGTPPVVLVTIDTLRADRLPAYGYRGVETPAIDRLRADGILFENAYTHCPLTLPSHVSLLTGRLPPDHGVRNNIGYRFDASLPSLPSLLKARGYATAAAVSAWVLRAETGLGPAFDRYSEVAGGAAGRTSAAELQRPGRETVKAALEFAAAQGERPFFLFVHLFEPHAPYDPPPAERARYGATYEGEIAAADAALGALVDGLRGLGVYDRALVVLASDHGEGLGEHGEEEHGILLYRNVLHVPLIVKLPRALRAGARVARPVGLVDVLPTVAEVAGFTEPKDLPGHSLLAERATTAGVYSETYYPRIHLGWSELHSFVDDRYHLIEGPRPELYDLTRDPGEQQDLSKDAESTMVALAQQVHAAQGTFRAPSSASASERESLQALGYLGGGPGLAGGDAAMRLPNPRDHIGARADLKRAVRLAADGHDEEALRALTGLLRAEPALFDAEVERARILARLGRLDEAAGAYRSAMELSPALAPTVALALAEVCLDKGDLAGAEAAARTALAQEGAAAQVALARVALARGDLDRAAEAAALVKGDAVAEARAAVVLAEVDVRRGRFESALGRLDAAETRLRASGEPPVAGMAFIRGDALARLARNAQAEVSLRAEIERYPRNARAYASLALVVALQGRSNEAPAILAAMQQARPGPDTKRLADRTREFMRGGSGAGS
jgi:arylsulfatase A-like enzyme/tetratricopeptide (TPR) repeat protein